MARHLMAVCVVCLLCAEHLPCKDHVGEGILSNSTQKTTTGTDLQNDLSLRARTSDNSIYKDDNALRIEYQYVKRKGRTRETGASRSKRHAHHVIGTDRNMLSVNELDNSRRFMRKLFEQYGDVDSMSMNMIGFEKMLNHLGLHSLIEERIAEHDHHLHEKTSTSNESCISSLDLVSRITSRGPVEEEHHQTHNIKLNSTVYNETLNNSTGINESKDEHDELKKHTHLDSNNLLAVCPILLYQLTAPTSHERSGCVYSSLISSKMDTSFEYIEEPQDRLSVWLFASLSVLGVSLVGLLGVAVIPCMDRHFYQHAIQFLVALAVGTLAGDALLHLLPHSMMSFASVEEDSHSSMVWKGLIAVLGIIFFFAMERGLTMIAEWRKKIEKKEKPSSRVRVMRDPDSGSITNSTAGDKLCKHKYSSYPYCYDEIAMDTKDDHHHHHRDTANDKAKVEKSLTSSPVANNKNNIHVYRKNNEIGDHNETAQSLLPHNYTTITDNYTAINNKEDSAIPDNNTVSTNLDDTSMECTKDKSLVREETYTIILREHESSHHGHSHKHGHVHSPPRSLSAVAWMVVMGDGLHNFTDGMAIGAAFSNNIAGGFSTAIAVFCHELPHELGDFAVLLKAGMSAKQAVYYNLLSSVLSFFGMVLGVIIGDKPEASAWIFACAAGMFIYIALVDMMPELTSTHNERCALSQCLLQLLGMSCGLGIMLLIALYEHDLKNMFSPSHNHGHVHH